MVDMWLYNCITKDLDSQTPRKCSIPVVGRPVGPETHRWGYAQPGILPRMGAIPATRQVELYIGTQWSNGTRIWLGDGLEVQKA